MRFCAVGLYLARFLCYWRRKTPMTLKSGFRMGQSHWKLHHWIHHVLFPIGGLVINFTLGHILYCLWDLAFDRSTAALFCYPLAFCPPMEGVSWDDLRKILHGGDRMAKEHSGEDTLPKALTPWVGARRTNVTDRRQTDGFAITNTRSHVRVKCNNQGC